VQTVTSGSQTFTIPSGVFSIAFAIRDPECSLAAIDNTALPAMQYVIAYDSRTITRVALDGTQVVIADCADGASFLTNVDRSICASDCEKITFQHFSGCPPPPGLLEAQFAPLLKPYSTLALQNNIGLLNMFVSIPSHYFGATFSYPDQCTVAPSTRLSSNVACASEYFVSIAYTDNCQFQLIANPDNDAEFLYKGTLTVGANVVLGQKFLGRDVTREVSSLIRWSASLPRTITVSTEVVVQNPTTCNDGSVDECGYEIVCSVAEPGVPRGSYLPANNEAAEVLVTQSEE